MINLDTLSEGWKIVDNTLQKTFEFKGYLKTMFFANAVAWEANKQIHHPEMRITFNQCLIILCTHDEGNILTEKDIAMAKAIDDLTQKNFSK